MKEEIIIKINYKPILIGYSSMMAPTALRESNRVFKMLQLKSKEEYQQGDIFFFEYRCSKNGKEEWCLLPEYGFVNLDGPEELINLYERIPHLAQITFDEFVELVFRAYY